jgi:hypothetical protein
MPEQILTQELQLRLSRNDVGQIIEGIDVLIEQWEATAEYLETGNCPDDVCIREASDVYECRRIALTYREIRSRISSQLESQVANGTR